MKIFSITLSTSTILAIIMLLVIDFPDLTTFNGVIFFLLLVVLFLICVTGIIINMPRISFKSRNRLSISYGKH